MHKIQSIEPRRRHLARVCLAPPPDLTVYEEDRRSLLPELENGQPLVDRTIIERLNLAVGDALSANDVQQLVKVSLCFRAKERAVWHLASADYSTRGLYQKLRPVFGAVPAEFAVTQMRQRGYLNDEHYAERLAQALNAKGAGAGRCRGGCAALFYRKRGGKSHRPGFKKVRAKNNRPAGYSQNNRRAGAAGL